MHWKDENEINGNVEMKIQFLMWAKQLHAPRKEKSAFYHKFSCTYRKRMWKFVFYSWDLLNSSYRRKIQQSFTKFEETCSVLDKALLMSIHPIRLNEIIGAFVNSVRSNWNLLVVLKKLNFHQLQHSATKARGPQ